MQNHLDHALSQKEDNQISCFKPGRLCEVGRQILNQQIKLLIDESHGDSSTHLREIFTVSDVKDEDKETNIIERDEEIDKI